MFRAFTSKAAVVTILALATFPDALLAQDAGPGLPPPGGGVPDRLSPDEIERAGRRRDLEGTLAQLREYHARGEYAEMMRLLQDAERAYPNDFKLRTYGYLAQQGLEMSQRSTPEPVIAPDSPVLPNRSVAPTDSGALSGLPSLPVAAGGQTAPPAASGLPTLPAPGEGETAAAPSRPTPAPAATKKPAPPKKAVKEIDQFQIAQDQHANSLNKWRKILIGVAGVAAAIGVAGMIRRRMTRTAADGAAGAVAATPPPIPASTPPAFSSSYSSMRDAMTEVEANEEEVARGIAESIGTRPAPSAAVAMPAFDSLFDDRMDHPTGFHETMPTMVDAADEEDEEQRPPAGLNSFDLTFAPSPGTAEPAVSFAPPEPFSPTPAASGAGGGSFEDLGLVLFADPPPQPSAAAASPAPAPPAAVPAAKAQSEEDPFAAFNFGGVEIPPLKESLGNPSGADSPVKPPAQAPAPASLPGLPAGDEPIRLNDLNLFGNAGETAVSPFESPRPQESVPKAAEADPLSSTVDLSEVLFGNYNPSAASDKPRVPSASDETVMAAPPMLSLDAEPTASAGHRSAASAGSSAMDETVVLRPSEPAPLRSEEGLISLDSLGLGLDSVAAPAQGRAPMPDLHNEDTVHIPAAAFGASKGAGRPDGAPDATVSFLEETVGLPSIAPSLDGLDRALEGEGSFKPEEQSYYASAGKTEGNLDERSERMFHEQCGRAEKAVAESNWKQAVHYLSIAAAIRPEDPEVIQKLKLAREQKRKQEAEV